MAIGGSADSIRQFAKFAAIGVMSNSLLMAIYLGLTSFGVGHKSSATIVYLAGTLNGFWLNKTVTFNHKGNSLSSGVKYGATYLAGYIANMAALYILVDVYGIPHQWVQIPMVFVIAISVFFLQKCWVFSASPFSQ